MEICAIVNALIPPVEFPARLLIQRSEWSEVMAAVRRGVPHFIRHAATAELLGVEPQAGWYEPRPGDAYLVVRLKPGVAPRGVEVKAGIDDLEVLKVEVM